MVAKFDKAGRLNRSWVEEALGLNLHYDGHGRLAYVEDNAGTVLEQYWYDAQGRLASYKDLAAGGTGQRLYTYDHSQMLSAMDTQGNVLWEAIWGPGQDRLVGYSDYVTGQDLITITNMAAAFQSGADAVRGAGKVKTCQRAGERSEPRS